MQLHPTQAAVHLSIAGALVVASAVLARQAPILAWGGAILVGLAIARAVTRLSVTRIRSAGFEMLWRETQRKSTIGRHQIVELKAEVRNRDSRAARYVELRAIASPNLSIRLEPSSGEVPAGGRLAITLSVSSPRTGFHGIHGLALEVQGSPGLYEVPLTFSNPYGIEILPEAYQARALSARGGRSRHVAESARRGRIAGEGLELKELREHQAGDSFKRIAWKASARRGKLMVREYEQEERDVVWLLLDASVELWAGNLGQGPLDLAIEELTAIASRHLSLGDRVGLAICSSRTLAFIPAESGPAQLDRIARTLAHATNTHAFDRSDLDESDAALRVLEHLRPLEPAATEHLRADHLDEIARRAATYVAQAPFHKETAQMRLASTPREAALRRYLLAFGVYSPPRQEPEAPLTDATLAECLARIATEKPRASLLVLASPSPDFAARPLLKQALSRVSRHRTAIFWLNMRYEQSLPKEGGMAQVVSYALSLRERAQRGRGLKQLKQLGIRALLAPSPPRSSKPAEAAAFAQKREGQAQPTKLAPEAPRR